MSSDDLNGSAPRGPAQIRVPPYLLTGGRARPADESVEIEAQVVSTPAGLLELGRLSFETRDIVALCQEPHAVAEVASLLGLHLGVTRVLVGDLVRMGCLSVRRPQFDPATQVQLIERVIRGLDRIA